MSAREEFEKWAFEPDESDYNELDEALCVTFTAGYKAGLEAAAKVEWIDIRTFPEIEEGKRVWFANDFGVWAGRWDKDEHHKGAGRAYPVKVSVIETPAPPEPFRKLKDD